MTRTNLGTFRGANNPSQVLSENRAYNWRLFAWFLAVNAVQVFAWLLWADKF